jgi:hypothetical protein
MKEGEKTEVCVFQRMGYTGTIPSETFLGWSRMEICEE